MKKELMYVCKAYVSIYVDWRRIFREEDLPPPSPNFSIRTWFIAAAWARVPIVDAHCQPQHHL